MTAAALSISGRDWRVFRPESWNCRCAWTVVSRSSTKTTGISVSSRSRSPHSRAPTAAGPSVPSRRSGSPMTISAAPCSVAKPAISRWASSDAGTAGRGVTRSASRSQTAMPIRTEPTSHASRAWLATAGLADGSNDCLQRVPDATWLRAAALGQIRLTTAATIDVR
jgi:hypothetical protein